MRFARKKKGVSPVIATVLLVSLVLVLVAIIFLWSKQFITEQVQKNGADVNTVCKDVVFDVEHNLGSSGASNSLELQFVNRGNVNIYDFDIKAIGDNGDSVIKKYGIPVDIGGATEPREIILDEGTAQIVIYPQVLGSVVGKKTTKAVTCLDKGQTLTINN